MPATSARAGGGSHPGERSCKSERTAQHAVVCAGASWGSLTRCPCFLLVRRGSACVLESREPRCAVSYSLGVGLGEECERRGRVRARNRCWDESLPGRLVLSSAPTSRGPGLRLFAASHTLSDDVSLSRTTPRRAQRSPRDQPFAVSTALASVIDTSPVFSICSSPRQIRDTWLGLLFTLVAGVGVETGGDRGVKDRRL